jgi:PST family polysaccharide transporter
LARKAAAGAIYIGGAQAFRAFSMIISTIILARVLSPGDFGVIAMSAPILAFVLLFQDLGLSAATVQSRSVSSEQSTALFWLNFGVSIAIGALLVVLGPAIGSFYRDSRVGEVTAATAAMVIVTSVAIQHTALLNREMRYREMAIIVIASSLSSALVTIALAFWLVSYWALFLGSLTGAFVQATMTWRAHHWRPALRVSWSEARGLVGFGGYVVSFDLLNFLNRNIDSVLLGRVWGAGPLGLYERSQKLMLAPLQLVNSPLNRVMLPLLSRLRDEPERYRWAYLFALRGLLLVTVPTAVLAIAASDAVISVLLGPVWSAASPIFFWLAFATLYQPIGASTAWLFLSSGRAKAYAQWGALSSVITVASFLAGLPWGPVGVAKAYVLGGALLRLPFLLYWAPKSTPVRSKDIGVAVLPFAIAGAAAWLLIRAISSMHPIPLIIVGGALSFLTTLGVLYGFRDGRRFLSEASKLAWSSVRAGTATV